MVATQLRLLTQLRATRLSRRCGGYRGGGAFVLHAAARFGERGFHHPNDRTGAGRLEYAAGRGFDHWRPGGAQHAVTQYQLFICETRHRGRCLRRDAGLGRDRLPRPLAKPLVILIPHNFRYETC